MTQGFKRKIVSFFLKSHFDKPIQKPKSRKILSLKKLPIFSSSIFNKRKKKIRFYVIRVHKSGGGLFSNVLHVLNHIRIAKKLKLVPIVDMENFYTLYNENNKIDGTNNSWLYYFEQISNFSLDKIYNSSKIVFSDPQIKMPRNFETSSNFKNLFKKNITIKKKFVDNIKKFQKKNFFHHKTIGIHLRGTDMRITPNHPLPPTVEQVFNIVDKLLYEKKFNKIFLVTDQKSYLDQFIKKYKSLLCYTDCFRSNKNKIFDLDVRKNHRYKLGKESLEQMLLLSKLEYLITSKSNLSRCSVMLSNKRIKCLEINNGNNSKKILYSRIKWFVKKMLPKKFGGFNQKIEIKFQTYQY
tara:strand:- start:35 stop:1093 length:1059 start_codon:yes stop_codon:yes gene_type:complete